MKVNLIPARVTAPCPFLSQEEDDKVASGAQRSGSELGSSEGQVVSSSGNDEQSEVNAEVQKKPCFDGVNQNKAVNDIDCQKRRTRGSNPQPVRATDFESAC